MTNIKIEVTELLKEAPERMGNNSNTSTSKTKKIIATRKNRKENGERLSSIVENPHSNGLAISRSSMFLREINNINENNKRLSTKLEKKNSVILRIALT